MQVIEDPSILALIAGGAGAASAPAPASAPSAGWHPGGPDTSIPGYPPSSVPSFISNPPGWIGAHLSGIGAWGRDTFPQIFDRQP